MPPPPVMPEAGARDSWKTAALALAVAAILTQSGVRNLLWTIVVVGAPLTTAGFVYGVVRMHQARLQHEFVAPSAVVWMHDGPDPDLIDIRATVPSLADARPDRDLRQQLFAMLIVRARFVDVHGSEPALFSAANRRMAQTMMLDDETMFTKLAAEKQKDLDTYLFNWRSDAERLRVLHAQLKTLARSVGSGAAATER